LLRQEGNPVFWSWILHHLTNETQASSPAGSKHNEFNTGLSLSAGSRRNSPGESEAIASRILALDRPV